MIWHAKKWKVNVCGWFIHLTICWILLFLIWQSELRGQHCVRYYRKQIAFYSWKRPISVVVVVVVLNTLWNSYLNQATKNVYIYLCLPNFPIFKEIPWWKFSKPKRKPFYHLGNFNSPFHLQPPPSAKGPRVKRYCLRCSDQCCWSVSFK